MPTMIENYYIILQLYELFWTIHDSEKFEKKVLLFQRGCWGVDRCMPHEAQHGHSGHDTEGVRALAPDTEPAIEALRSLVNKRSDRSGGPRRKPLASSPNNL